MIDQETATKIPSRFEEASAGVPTPSPLRASNMLESLKPRDISWPLATLPGPGYAGAPADVPPELEPVFISGLADASVVRKTNGLRIDNSGPQELKANVLPVNWPASNKVPKPFLLPSIYDRVVKLEEQVDSLLDRIALHNVRSSHKI